MLHKLQIKIGPLRAACGAPVATTHPLPSCPSGRYSSCSHRLQLTHVAFIRPLSSVSDARVQLGWNHLDSLGANVPFLSTTVKFASTLVTIQISLKLPTFYVGWGYGATWQCHACAAASSYSVERPGFLFRCFQQAESAATVAITAEGLIFPRGEPGAWDAAAVGHPIVRCAF